MRWPIPSWRDSHRRGHVRPGLEDRGTMPWREGKSVADTAEQGQECLMRLEEEPGPWA